MALKLPSQNYLEIRIPEDAVNQESKAIVQQVGQDIIEFGCLGYRAREITNVFFRLFSGFLPVSLSCTKFRGPVSWNKSVFIGL